MTHLYPRSRAALLIGLLAFQIASSTCRAGTATPRLVTVRDMIEMTKLADPLYFAGGSSRGRVASFSPDGRQFIVVLRRGDIASDTNRFSMLLWNSIDAYGQAAKPRTLLEMSSSSNRGAINGVEWSADNETVTFLGENPGEEQQVFELNTRIGALKRLTDHPTSVLSFSRDSSGARMAYVATRAEESIWDEQTRRHGVLVSDQFLPDLMTGQKGLRFRGRREEEADLFFKDAEDVKPMRFNRPLPRVSFIGSKTATLSPNGDYIVAATQVPIRELPSVWREYRDYVVKYVLQPAFDKMKGRGRPTETWLQSYEVIDTRTGHSRILLNAPIAPSSVATNAVVWAPDGRSVILSNIFLPLEIEDSVERDARTQRPYTVEVDLASGAIVQIGEHCLGAVRWDAVANELTCAAQPDDFADVISRYGEIVESQESGKASRDDLYQPGGEVGTFVRYRKSGNQWHEVGTLQSQRSALDVFIKEDMNTAPKIHVRQASNKKETLLWDLNPQLKALRFGKVEEVVWEWAKGQRIRGGLYYPPDYRPGRRYPLVLQTHDWNPYEFWIDGPWTTAYAAQALAARGMVVLQLLDEYIPEQYGSDGQLKEVEKALAIYRSAIDFLDQRGLIDARRVGVIGFSHTCFYVKYALAHAPSLFAAASVAEGEDGGYLQFMTRGNSFVDADSLYGGAPFGENLPRWMQRSPGFNLNRVRTPLWINTLNPRFLLGDWEWFEGLTLLQKPVELVMLEDGDHMLQKPAERMVSQGGNVDWFDFWLNGHEDPDPAKTGQYTRWRKLRELPPEQGR